MSLVNLFILCVLFNILLGFLVKKISLRFVKDGILNNNEVQRVVEDYFLKYIHNKLYLTIKNTDIRI